MEYKRVVWSEGMFLRPHHFQQMERYFEQQARILAESHAGIYWGFRTLEPDTDALATGVLALHSASGVFPDGTPFTFNRPDDAPPPLRIPPGTHDRDYVLALPARRDGEHEITFEPRDGTLARYGVTEDEMRDACDVALEPALLQVGSLRLRLMARGEAGGEWVALGFARIADVRSDGRVELDNGYIPPVLAAQASTTLMSWLRETLSLLEARGMVLAQRLSMPGRGGISEQAEFMLLAAINRYRGVFAHACQLAIHHPERLFHDLLMLAGELDTLTTRERRQDPFPAYSHDDLASCLLPLLMRVRRALAVVIEDGAIQVPLDDKGQGVRVGIMADPALRKGSLVLAVHAEMPDDMLRARFPAQAKLGPVERIRDLVHLQLPGIALKPLPAAPARIPYHAGHIYFELEKHGEMWKQFQATGSLALHLAGDFPGLVLECWAIREQGR